ncbi:SDR family NAD(P)-dependent oxidoreductase [Sphingomonas sp. 67-41]|jgi:NAD(P)-dependent dehydrogenase (short-subunit alcohol dehydrogenase family)|uniref:SDR family NAD(P)-dependent oxidoreductase n=1 Tax=Sphingomonas TaxID=13687 RepID=UPI000967096C|nr:SDR family NAD(P)-dependent oxidoreductase [Sphingomonas sp. 67-41]OJY53858.1 MAG: 3-hydroxy-2-methylbutyryl-CoA dehydrogenase [Sphingomonas sp. 67-41]
MKLDSSISAVVTGGASGLGLATVKALRAQDVKVAILDLNAEAGERAAAETGAIYCQVDVLSDESVDAAFAKARAANGQERILVNCAGGGNSAKTAGRDRKTGEIKMFPTDKFAWVLMLNTVGTFRCITRAAAGMLTLDPIDGERGAIVSTASAAAQDGQMGQAAYSASKAAVVGMTLPIARDLSSEGIRVNTIMPGIFDTPLMMGAPDNVKEALAASVPFPKRFGNPSEYASLVLEMVRNGYFNGETVRLDGAIRMPPR